MQAGFGMTNPDPGWSSGGLHMFDVGEIAQDDSEEIISRVARPMRNLIQAAAGYCNNDDCKVKVALQAYY